MTDVWDWSATTPGANDTIDQLINWQEGQPPSTVNNSARAMMTRVSQVLKDLSPSRRTTGTGNTYLVTAQSAVASNYRDGEIVTSILDRTNTGAATLNSNNRGARPWRPASGIEFKAGELQALTPVISMYVQGTDEFLAVGTGYHVDAMTNGLLTQSVAASLLRIGTPMISLAPSPNPGWIRLTESTQTLNKSDWPQLSAWLAGLSTPYPWGSTSTTFSLPPAAGYMLRFAGITSAVDPDGPRALGSTQTDGIKTHTHTGTTNAGSAHHHGATWGSVGASTGGGAYITNIQPTGLGGGSFNTTDESAHTHPFTTDATGITETRPKNVAFAVDIYASSALASGTLGIYGFSFLWDPTTSAGDPGAGHMRGNNSTLGSITNIYLSTTDNWGVTTAGAAIAAMSSGATIRLTNVGAQNNCLIVRVGTPVNNTTYWTLPVTSVVMSNGSFANGSSLALEIIAVQGPQGLPGVSTVVGGRDLLTSNRVYYVRSDGSDASAGISDAAGGAFKTWQAAVNAVAKLDFNGFTVTIQHGSDGVQTFTEAVSIGPMTGGGVLNFNGAGRSTTLFNTAGECFTMQNVGHTEVLFSNMKLSTTSGGTGGHCIKAAYETLAALGAGMEFGAAYGHHIWMHDNQCCMLILNTSYYISGNAQCHLFIQNKGHVFLEATTINLVGTPNFSTR